MQTIHLVKIDTWATRTQGLSYNIICRELFNILQWKNPIQVIFKIVRTERVKAMRTRRQHASFHNKTLLITGTEWGVFILVNN